jgi:formylglycine-generating enzyme required for sulfatase activity
VGEGGFRLPTEAEWEYAARGPDERVYPWGDAEPTCALANSADPTRYCVEGTAPVGSYSPAGDSWVGAADMAGNVFEWVSSLARLYPYDAADGREDPADGENPRSVRSSSFFTGSKLAHAALRAYHYPYNWFSIYGFRVVYGPAVPDPEAAAPTATPILTLTPFPAVTANDQWTPVYQTINGVEMALVPAGCFHMGNDPDAVDYTDERQEERPMVSDGGEQCFDTPFWIGRTEVTNAQYGECVAARACELPEYVDSPSLSGADQPVVGVSWLDARDYTAWLNTLSPRHEGQSSAESEGEGAGGEGFRLPSEAEWEYAARGPEALIYPWGNDFDGTRVNYCDEACSFEWSDAAADDGYRSTAPVGTYSPAGDSWVGAADLAGNVWEWVSSRAELYPYDAADGREGPAGTTNPVIRGGAWMDYAWLMRAAVRDDRHASIRFSDAGFRVVYGPAAPTP